MGIEVKLEVFEGPLDLLLHLIEKNKIDIYDIPIAEITEQYLEYVEEIKETDLDIMSDFILVGAQLVNIKSRMLLPLPQPEEEGESIDPRAELVARLLEYKMYKYSASLLKDRVEDAAMLLFKKPTIPKEVSDYVEKPEMSEIIGDLTLAKLRSIFDFVIKKQIEKKDPIRSEFGKIKKESVSLTDCITKLREYGSGKREFLFRKYLMEQESRIHIIVHFLAILELMKIGILKAEEEEGTEEVWIRFVEDRELTEEEYKGLGEI